MTRAPHEYGQYGAPPPPGYHDTRYLPHSQQGRFERTRALVRERLTPYEQHRTPATDSSGETPPNIGEVLDQKVHSRIRTDMLQALDNGTILEFDPSLIANRIEMRLRQVRDTLNSVNVELAMWIVFDSRTPIDQLVDKANEIARDYPHALPLDVKDALQKWTNGRPDWQSALEHGRRERRRSESPRGDAPEADTSKPEQQPQRESDITPQAGPLGAIALALIDAAKTQQGVLDATLAEARHTTATNTRSSMAALIMHLEEAARHLGEAGE
jgi:hypothetical protein